ncbi:MAG: 4'-phosphopantetheinyl transferase superfamily protein [Mucilaginibacter sp.]|nr:4'-phosphopantetheinyl transferase superfamily protein [Mucilaginibacter sp.]
MGILINRYTNDVAWQTIAGDLTLPQAGEVHVWRVNITANLKRLGAFQKLLKSNEMLRGDRYMQLKDRQRFVISRAMQRIILGRYLNANPEELTFELGNNKKPYLPTGNGTELQYNISHAGDWILLAVSQAVVGADVEYVDPNLPFDDILPGNFTEKETEFVKATDATNRFYQLRTRKEAFLKATGQGLGDHLRDTPSLDGEHNLKASLHGADKDWDQQSFLVAEDYLASVTAAGKWQLKAFDVNF